MRSNTDVWRMIEILRYLYYLLDSRYMTIYHTKQEAKGKKLSDCEACLYYDTEELPEFVCRLKHRKVVIDLTSVSDKQAECMEKWRRWIWRKYFRLKDLENKEKSINVN